MISRSVFKANIRSFYADFRLSTCQDACASQEHRTNLALRAIPVPNEMRARRGPGRAALRAGAINSAPPRSASLPSFLPKQERRSPGRGQGALPLSQHSTKTYYPSLSVKNHKLLPRKPRLYFAYSKRRAKAVRRAAG